MREFEAIAGSDPSAYGTTSLHPLGLIAVIALGLATLRLPRRYALIPVFVMACFVSPAQRLVIMSLDFTLLRIMVLFVGARILMLQEYRGFVWNRLDTLFVAAWAVTAVVYTLQWGRMSAAITQLGSGFEGLGIYFLVRITLRDWEGFIAFVRIAAVIAAVEAAFFLFENFTRYNPFSVFGGVPKLTLIREGRLRCQGPFPHAIIAGVFWAVLVPLFAALWWRGRRDRILAYVGVAGGVIIVYCCASSTPVLALAAGIFGAVFFTMRGHMRYVVWASMGLLAILHLVMQAPVWHLIARISAVGGSTGYHRYKLIDEAISNFGEWAVLGTKTTAHWGHGLQDVTNQYVLYGVRGGAGTLLLVVWMLIVAYGYVGQSLKASAHHRPTLIMVWAIGVMLFVHCTSFIGVSYFGQADMMWSLSLAIVGSLPCMLSRSEPSAQATSGVCVGSSRTILRNLR